MHDNNTLIKATNWKLAPRLTVSGAKSDKLWHFGGCSVGWLDPPIPALMTPD
jgi:hypothetical protein